MRRPSGFDREPESREPESLEPELSEAGFPEEGFSDADFSEPGFSAPESSAPERMDPELGDPETDESPTADDPLSRARAGATAAGESQEIGETGIAPTVDLGEVRESGLSSGVLGRLRGGADRGDGGDALSGRNAARSGAGSRLMPFRGDRDEDPIRAAERRVRSAEKERKAQERRERRRFSAESRKRRRVWWLGLGVIAALALFVAIGVFTPLMAVRDIELVGAERVDEQAVRKALSRFDGVPIALVRDADVHRALEPFPSIQSYATEVIPPSTLVVRIEERVAVVAVADGKKFKLYDSAGVLLSTVGEQPKSVPLASGKVADLASEPFSAATRALRDMPAKLREQIVKVTASSGQNVEFQLRSGVDVLWGDAENSRRKSVVLQSMLSSGALKGKQIERIDVSSFEAPVFS